MTASQIAHIVHGQLFGNPNDIITGISHIDNATINDVSFVSDAKYEKFIPTTKAKILLTIKKYDCRSDITYVIVDKPRDSFVQLLDYFQDDYDIESGNNHYIHESVQIGKNTKISDFVYISQNSKIGDNVIIYPHVFIGHDVNIGDNCIIYPNVTIYHDSIIGNNCILHAGVVIGSDGFGFIKMKDMNKKIPHLGNVIIHDEVEIGANSIIDRSVVGSTVIKNNVKLDNLVHVGHNVIIEERVMMAAQTGIAGSTRIGHDCLFGGQVGVAGHLKVKENTIAAGKAGIINNCDDNAEPLMGMPAIPRMKYLRGYAKMVKREK